MPEKVAYLMSRFPHLPETFILREMSELKRRGWPVSLYPLIHQKQTVVHQQAAEWMAEAHYSPFLSGTILQANLETLRDQREAYQKIWKQAVRENSGSPEFLVRTLALLPKAAYLAREMKRAGVVHIHAHYATHPALVAWAIHRLAGIPYSITVHAHDIFVNQSMLETKLQEASFVVAISDYNREFLSKTVGAWVAEKTHVVHCGIDPELYHPGVRLDQPAEKFEILNIGSLQPYKGHPYLIEACAILRDRGIPFRCRIIGGGEQGELQKQITQHELESSVELLGPLDQDKVAGLLPTANCYVQPSIVTPSGKMEGIPVSLMEALACERPVVATDISGIPELVQPGRTGYLVPPADARALAQALEYVYDHAVEAAGLAAAGRQLVLKEFNLQTNVGRLESLFQDHVHIESWAVESSALSPAFELEG